MKRIGLALFALMIGTMSLHAVIIERVKIGDLYYNLDTETREAEVTYEVFQPYKGKNYADLTDVYIPSFVLYSPLSYHVTRIGEFAFFGCDHLQNIVMPATDVRSIGEFAFAHCRQATFQYMLPRLKKIEDYAFLNCENLDLSSLPSSVATIGRSAFEGCRGITTLVSSGRLESIGDRAFKDCDHLYLVRFINLGQQGSVSDIGKGAFEGCNQLMTVTLPATVTWVGQDAFAECRQLTTITYPEWLDLSDTQIPESVDKRPFSAQEPVHFRMKKEDLLAKAEAKDVEAQFLVAHRYLLGWQGFEKSDEQAFYWFQKAAKKGHAKAQYELGKLYKNGQGVENNDSKAVKWYLKSAEQGYVHAQELLGFMYNHARGVKKDPVKAKSWYLKAAKQEDTEAQYNLGLMYELGDGIEQNLKQALFWYRKAAAHDYAWAQSNLGYMYSNGKGVEQDLEQAVFWYRHAAWGKDRYGMFNLGYMYEAGEGVEPDCSKAMYWYKRAIEQGYEKAQERYNALAEEGCKEAENE